MPESAQKELNSRAIKQPKTEQSEIDHPETKDLEIEQHVSYALIHIYLKQILPLKLANLLVVGLMVWVLWDDADKMLLLLWCVPHGLTVIIEVFIQRSFNVRSTSIRRKTWMRFFALATLISGLAWGAAVPLFMDVSNPSNVIIITILLLGMLSGCLYTLSILFPLFHIFSVAVLLCYAFSMYAEQGFMIIVIAALGLGIFFAWLSHQLLGITHDLLFSRYKIQAVSFQLGKAKELAEQASMAKTRFLATASHDIRQPLQAMALHAETLRSRLKDPENISSIQALKRSQKSMSEMMDALLDISKIDADIIQPTIDVVSMRMVITHLVNNARMMAQQKGLDIRMRVADVYVQSDVMLMKRILRNVISNAVRYTDTGEILVACRRRGGVVMVDVWDTGKGIPANQTEKVFMEFHQLDNPERDQQKGLGLGLAIVQRLTKLLPGHSIELCSRLGQGSRFRLSMPLEAHTASSTNIEGSMASMDHFHAMRVLVIEDDLAVRQAIVSLLQSWACQVMSTNTAAKAIALIEQGYVPQAMIADYRLPDQQTGLQAIMTIREISHQRIPALMLSGESLPESLQDMQGADVFLLHKPVAPAKLKLFLRRCSRKAYR